MVRKVPRPAVHTERAARVLKTAKHAVSVTLCISLKIVQLLAKSATNVVLRTNSAHVADHHRATDRTPTDAEVEHQHAVGALRDATDPAEAGTPDQGPIQGAVHRLEMPTASK